MVLAVSSSIAQSRFELYWRSIAPNKTQRIDFDKSANIKKRINESAEVPTLHPVTKQLLVNKG